jgi:hypothetical protein
MSKLIQLVLLCAALTLTALPAMAHPGATIQPNRTLPPGAVLASPSGVVVETMNAGGYTYVCLENGGKRAWAAIPATQVKVGEKVTITPGMVMHNFTSQSLHRNFKAIIFSRGLTKQ